LCCARRFNRLWGLANVVFELHYNETNSWKEWLKTNVGMEDAYARKLRTISDVFGKISKAQETRAINIGSVWPHKSNKKPAHY